MLLADTKDEEAPVDDFKQTHTKLTKKDGVSDKVNHVRHFPEVDDFAEVDPEK